MLYARCLNTRAYREHFSLNRRTSGLLYLCAIQAIPLPSSVGFVEQRPLRFMGVSLSFVEPIGVQTLSLPTSRFLFCDIP